MVRCLDADLHDVTSFQFNDHLGFITALPDNTLLAGSWGSRTWYRLDIEGRALDSRPNTTRHIDFQDITVTTPGHIVVTGVGHTSRPEGRRQIGGLALVDVDLLTTVWEAPVDVHTPNRRVATFNGTHIDVDTDRFQMSAVADDHTTTISTWHTEPIIPATTPR